MIRLVEESELRERISEPEALQAVERAFRAVAEGRVEQPPPMAFDFEQGSGEVHVKGAYLTAREVLRGMIRRKKGAVLNVGSLAGVRMIEAPIHYCASKAGLVGMTQAMAK